MVERAVLAAARKKTLALVLAGGRGSRLRQLTDHQSKPAVPFGGKFRIIDFPLSNCLNSGIRKIGVLTQYRAHSLIQHLQRGWAFLQHGLNEFIEIWPAQQQTDAESWYKGTADAVYQNLSTIRSYKPEYILILAGDHVYKQDYAQMLADHIERGADVSVSCLDVPVSQASSFGVVQVDEHDNIINFQEKPHTPATIPGRTDRSFASMGIYIFNTQFLINHLEEDARYDDSDHDFGKNLLPKMVGTSKIIAHRFASSCVQNAQSGGVYWRDVGTLDAYWEANMDLTHVVPDLDLYDAVWPIWTFQDQRPAAKFVFETDLRTGRAFDSLVSAGCIVSGSIVRRSLLFNNVRAHSFALIEDSVILPDCVINRHARLHKVILSEGCVIPTNMVIGENAETDSQRFFRTESGVVLVTPEMLSKLK